MNKAELIKAYMDGFGMTREQAIKAVEKAEECFVVPEREKGEWIEHDITELKKLGYYRCSKCNKGFKRFDYGERVSAIPMINGTHYALKIVDNFCPNCGADMRGGKE